MTSFSAAAASSLLDHRASTPRDYLRGPRLERFTFLSLAFATSKGRPTVSWLAGIGLLQLCTSGGVGCVAGVRDTLAPLGRTCSTYYHPADGLGGAFVLLALLIAVPVLLEYRRGAAPADDASSS